MKIYLDDIRNPVQSYPDSDNNWVIVRNYDEFVNHVTNNGLPEFVSFDHDLGLDANVEKTGYDCVKWLVNYCIDNNKPFPDYKVHSMNPIGKENIEKYITNFQDALVIYKLTRPNS